MRLIVLSLVLYFSGTSGVQTVFAASVPNIPQVNLNTISIKHNLSERELLAKPKYYISLIIDDMGYRFQSGKRAIALAENITYSFLPYAPHARELANIAHKQQKEIMLHIPMEAINGKRLGPGGLTTKMPKPVFNLELEHNLSAIPYIKGVNNHMGSLLTQQFEPMAWLMERLAKDKMYFVDSRTSGKSQALKAARQYGLPSETRDIFVDHDLSDKAMRQQLALAVTVAKRRGSVVVIAHPFPETIRVLKAWLPEAKMQGLEFVYMSQLLKIRKKYRAQRKIQKRISQWKIPVVSGKNN